MHSHKMTLEHAKEFMLSGNAIFTVVSGKTQARFTFKVSVSKKNEKFLYVGVLNGKDNSSDYAPMCYLDISAGLPILKRSSKTWISADAPCFIAFQYVFFNVLIGREINVEVWHEGRCGRCGRLLTVPESIENGIGPECIKKEQKIAL